MPHRTTERLCDVCRRRMTVRADVPHVRRTCSRTCAQTRHAAYVAAWRRGEPLGPVPPADGARAALRRLAAELVDADVRALVLGAARVLT